VADFLLVEICHFSFIMSTLYFYSFLFPPYRRKNISRFARFQGLFEKFLKLFASQMVKIENKIVYLF